MATISSASDYFRLVLEPNYNDAVTVAPDLRRIFNCASSLFHMHEWVFARDRSRAELALGTSFSARADVWMFVVAAIPEANFIRDLANGSKHVTLNNASTHATDIGMTSVQAGHDQAQWDTDPWDAEAAIVASEASDGPGVSFRACADPVFKFWRDLSAQL